MSSAHSATRASSAAPHGLSELRQSRRERRGDLGGDQLDARASGAEHLAAEQVERLHAVGALVDAGDLGVPEILLDAGLADEPRAAVQLRGEVRAFHRPVGQHRLDDRHEQREQRRRALRRLRILREIARCPREIRLVGEQPPGLGQRASVSSIRRTSGCTTIGSAARSGAWGPRAARPCSRSKA